MYGTEPKRQVSFERQPTSGVINRELEKGSETCSLFCSGTNMQEIGIPVSPNIGNPIPQRKLEIFGELGIFFLHWLDLSSILITTV